MCDTKKCCKACDNAKKIADQKEAIRLAATNQVTPSNSELV